MTDWTTRDAAMFRGGGQVAGYGYQWWVPDDSGANSAIGVYNQFVWVDPATRTVEAKTSAFRRNASTTTPESYREGDHFALFAAIARTR